MSTPRKIHDCAQKDRLAFKFKVGMVMCSQRDKKGRYSMAGKSIKKITGKKPGKSLLEKRADKRAKAESHESLFQKPRKNHR
ncbi:hypothetical protein AB4089_14860 [Arthrobacter sp. 2MCAF15]|uniref:hypothetical protein n=1 Tax=Arthrobacter sp. 2MCAF15 TaxID=3232984 RepID=UPI003F8EBA29